MKRIIKSSDVLSLKERVELEDALISLGPERIESKTWRDLIFQLEDNFDLEVDSAYRSNPQEFIFAYGPNGEEFEIEVTQYFNDGYEILNENIHATGAIA